MIRYWAFDVGRSAFSAKLINVENAGASTIAGAGLRITLARVTGASQALVGCASHDVDGDRRHAAFHRSRLSDAVTLHDVMIWAMPALYLAEYQFGCWILNRPVAQRVHFRQFRLQDYVHWHVFSRVVWPTFWPAFVGSLFLAIPSAILIYFLMRLLISRARMPQKTG